MSLFTNEPIVGLEPHTKAKLRSTQILTSLPQLVSELVQNSLDAGASHVEVGIDPSEWECWVRDDGQGISAEGMEMLTGGHDKGRYNTSKTYETSHIEGGTFGFRGEALASAMELTCLEISSRTSLARESWSVILKGGEQLYIGPSLRWRREKTGTTVVCRDIFFNVPVRRRSHPNVIRTLELTKKELETLALVFPHVSFSLDHTNPAQKNRVLTIPKTSSSLAAFRALYGKATVERVEEINIRSEDLTIEGFISLNGSHSRGLQNFYVNKHPMGFGEIQRAIEKRFAASNFSRFALNEDEDGFASYTQRSPKKTERKPVYVLNLTIPPTQVDNFIEPAKSMVRFQDANRVVAFVLEVVNRFLARNGLTSVSSNYSGTGNSKAKLPPGSPRKRIRRTSPELDSSDALSSFMIPNSSGDPSYSSESISTHKDGFGSLDVERGVDDSGYFEWVDPSSGESFLVDSDTGHSFSRNRPPGHIKGGNPSNYGELLEPAQTSYLDRRWLKANAATSSHDRNAEAKSATPTWLVSVLKRNTTFTPAEQRVFSTRTIGSNIATSSHLNAHTRPSFDNICVSNLSQSSQLTSLSFSRTELQRAEVVAQVDTKFIACVLQPTVRPERVLALVDQHAADERVRVERYLRRLCIGFLRGEVEKLRLEPSTKILLARQDLEMLARPGTLNALSRWGLCVDFHIPSIQHDPTHTLEFCQADVVAVPDVVSRRLAGRRELSEFVKAMLSTIETDGHAHWPSPSLVNQDDDWVKALRFCPAPLFELVNSRACRGCDRASNSLSHAHSSPIGAIMFNDPLDQRQCEQLIAQLAETVFPFQCAHGRPSVAPLVKLGHSLSERANVDWIAFEQEEL